MIESFLSALRAVRIPQRSATIRTNVGPGVTVQRKIFHAQLPLSRCENDGLRGLRLILHADK